MAINGWKIKARENPVGILAARFLGLEVVLVCLVFVTIFMQFRRKLVGIIGKILGELDSSCDFGDLCAEPTSLVTISLILFVCWFACLIIYTLYKSPTFRRCIQEVFVSCVAFSGVVFLVLGVTSKPINFVDCLIGITLLAVAAFVAFFTIEKIEKVSIRQAKPTEPKFIFPSFFLPLNWMVFVVAFGFWVGMSGLKKSIPDTRLVDDCNISGTTESKPLLVNNAVAPMENPKRAPAASFLVNGAPIICSREAYNCPSAKKGPKHKRLSGCEDVRRVWLACKRDVHRLDGDRMGKPCELDCGHD